MPILNDSIIIRQLIEVNYNSIGRTTDFPAPEKQLVIFCNTTNKIRTTWSKCLSLTVRFSGKWCVWIPEKRDRLSRNDLPDGTGDLREKSGVTDMMPLPLKVRTGSVGIVRSGRIMLPHNTLVSGWLPGGTFEFIIDLHHGVGEQKTRTYDQKPRQPAGQACDAERWKEQCRRSGDTDSFLYHFYPPEVQIWYSFISVLTTAQYNVNHLS